MGDVIFLADKLSVILMTLSVTFTDNLVHMKVIDIRFELSSQAMPLHILMALRCYCVME